MGIELAVDRVSISGISCIRGISMSMMDGLIGLETLHTWPLYSAWLLGWDTQLLGSTAWMAAALFRLD